MNNQDIDIKAEAFVRGIRNALKTQRKVIVEVEDLDMYYRVSRKLSAQEMARVTVTICKSAVSRNNLSPMLRGYETLSMGENLTDAVSRLVEKEAIRRYKDAELIVAYLAYANGGEIRMERAKLQAFAMHAYTLKVEEPWDDHAFRSTIVISVEQHDRPADVVPAIVPQDPPTPYDFGGTDEESHYMSQHRFHSEDGKRIEDKGD